MRYILDRYIYEARGKGNPEYSKFTYFHVANGVKQGGVFSPILFNFYINPLLQLLKKAGCGCDINAVYTGALYRCIIICR